jgi:hypothetical protein
LDKIGLGLERIRKNKNQKELESKRPGQGLKKKCSARTIHSLQSIFTG